MHICLFLIFEIYNPSFFFLNVKNKHNMYEKKKKSLEITFLFINNIILP